MDFQYVSWVIFARNIGSDVSNAIPGFIREIFWHSSIRDESMMFYSNAGVSAQMPARWVPFLTPVGKNVNPTEFAVFSAIQ